MARGCSLVVDNPYLYWARLTQLWRQHVAPYTPSAAIHPTAVVSETAIVDPTARIGPLCVVEEGAVIGAGTWLKSRVTVAAGCVIGENCILHAGVVIGADGFGFAQDQGQWVKIEQFGGVVIGNDVEIGANTTVDRGANRDTVIGEGTKIDNLVQIGHNVIIGRHCVIVSQVGISGSTSLGDFAVIGGQAGLTGHLKIGMGAQVAAQSGVMSDVPAGQKWGGSPAQPMREWLKSIVLLQKLAKKDPGAS